MLEFLIQIEAAPGGFMAIDTIFPAINERWRDRAIFGVLKKWREMSIVVLFDPN